MAEKEEKNHGKGNWRQRFSFKKMNRKYVFMMSDDETQEPIVDFKLNPLRLSLLFISVVLFFMVVTALVIAFTPIKEYLPGYNASPALERQVYDLSRKADSLERDLRLKDQYFNNLKLVIEGYDFTQDSLEYYDVYAPLLGINPDTIQLRHSPQDSALRAEFEEEQHRTDYETRHQELGTK